MLEHSEDKNFELKMEITCVLKDFLTHQANEAVWIKNCGKSDF